MVCHLKLDSNESTQVPFFMKSNHEENNVRLRTLGSNDQPSPHVKSQNSRFWTVLLLSFQTELSKNVRFGFSRVGNFPAVNARSAKIHDFLPQKFMKFEKTIHKFPGLNPALVNQSTRISFRLGRMSQMSPNFSMVVLLDQLGTWLVHFSYFFSQGKEGCAIQMTRGVPSRGVSHSPKLV